MVSLRQRFTAASVAALLAFAGCTEDGSAQASVPATATVAADARFESVRTEILERVGAGDIPSLSVAVAKDGVILWEEAFGWADVEQDLPATPATGYAAASIVKTVTSVGVLKAVDLGVLSLETRAVDHLQVGDLTSRYYDVGAITVRDLLTMSAGVPQGFKFNYDPDRDTPLRDSLRAHGGQVVFPPGSFYYSNYSHELLELVVEDAYDAGFDEFMRTEVFAPLEMTSSYYTSYGSPDGAVAATGYVDGLPAAPRGAKAAVMRVSAHDLVRMGAMLAGAPVEGSALSEEMRAKLLETAFDMPAPRADYAHGIWRRDLESYAYFIADGWGVGSVGEVLAFPDHGLAIVTLMNGRKRDDTFPGMINAKYSALIAEQFLPGFYDQMVAANEAGRTFDTREPVPAAFLGDWAGAVRDYRGEKSGVVMTFQADGDVHVKLEGRPRTLLSGVRYDQELLRGAFVGWLSVESEPDGYHGVNVALRLDGDRLTGSFEANYADDTGEFGLPNLVWLERPAAD